MGFFWGASIYFYPNDRNEARTFAMTEGNLGAVVTPVTWHAGESQTRKKTQGRNSKDENEI